MEGVSSCLWSCRIASKGPTTGTIQNASLLHAIDVARIRTRLSPRLLKKTLQIWAKRGLETHDFAHFVLISFKLTVAARCLIYTMFVDSQFLSGCLPLDSLLFNNHISLVTEFRDRMTIALFLHVECLYHLFAHALVPVQLLFDRLHADLCGSNLIDHPLGHASLLTVVPQCRANRALGFQVRLSLPIGSIIDDNVLSCASSSLVYKGEDLFDLCLLLLLTAQAEFLLILVDVVVEYHELIHVTRALIIIRILFLVHPS